ncbi:hypothetical protein ACFOW3_13400 [Acidovorax facilis]|uniref:DUF4394 domain-containing protein n=1 Tax=Acidovorax facilis TaxID=12917 RepID=A0ABV8DAM2_9BURK|nr:hypothetical protein [Acidovorax facilis]MCO4240842.1 hypothetical protein [Acidovorax facilis]
MANKLYPLGAQKILGAVNLSTDTIKAALLSDAYTYSAAHEFLSDVSATVLDTAVTLTSKSITGGVFDAADAVFTLVDPGANAKFVVLYVDTGVAGTSSLLYLVDTATGLTMTTNGGDITAQWDNGANKIFSLV